MIQFGVPTGAALPFRREAARSARSANARSEHVPPCGTGGGLRQDAATAKQIRQKHHQRDTEEKDPT